MREIFASFREPRERYQNPDGLVVVSADLEEKRRLQETQAADGNTGKTIDGLLHLQTGLVKVKHLLADIADETSKKTFSRENGEWSDLVSAFSPVWYTGKALLRLSYGTWKDQATQCFAPWSPWNGGSLLADVLRWKAKAGLNLGVIWTAQERTPRMVVGQAYYEGKGVMYDELGHTYPTYGGRVTVPIPSYGIAINTLNYQLDQTGSAVSHASFVPEQNVPKFVPWAGKPAEPYKNEMVAEDAQNSILCVRAGP